MQRLPSGIPLPPELKPPARPKVQLGPAPPQGKCVSYAGALYWLKVVLFYYEKSVYNKNQRLNDHYIINEGE